MTPYRAARLREIERNFRHVVLLSLLYLLPAVHALSPLDDPDIWWHLRTGQWIIEHGTVPFTDPFSSYGQGTSWFAYSWLFDVLVYRIFDGFGSVGIVFFTVIFGLLIVLAIHGLVRRAHLSLVQEILITAAALICLTSVMSPRPWLFSILFFVLELGVLLRFRRTRESRELYWLPLIFAAWANVHVQFVYGLAVLLLLTIEPVAQRLLLKFQKSFASTDPVHPARVLPRVTILCLLATLANPYHIYIYRPIIDVAMQTKAFDVITELQSISFRSIDDWIFLGLILGVVFWLGRVRESRVFHLGLLAMGVFLSFRARRDIWVGAVAAVAIVSDWQRPQIEARPVSRNRLIVVAAIIALGLVYFAHSRNISKNELWAHVAKHYPLNAVRFIQKNKIPGPLFNHYDWGGFLIWGLPELAVSMDGRSNLHGEARIKRNRHTWWGLPGWNTDPELTQAKVIIGPIDLPLTTLLRTDARFGLCYEDAIAVVFVAAAEVKACRADDITKRISLVTETSFQPAGSGGEPSSF